MAEGDVAAAAVTVDLLNGNGSSAADTTITESCGVKSTDAVSVVKIVSVVPQLLIKDSKASEAIQFYKTAFGAEELKRENHPKRKADQELPSVVSAHLKLGSFVFVVSDHPDAPNDTLGNGSFKFCIETDGDVNGVVKNAVTAGAVLDGEVTEGADACCAGPVGKLNDPYGFAWVICSAQKTQVSAADVEA